MILTPFFLLSAARVFLDSAWAIPLGTSYATKETHSVPPGWTNVGVAPSNHQLELKIGLKQDRFHELEKRLYEGYAGCKGINPWTGRGTVVGYLEPDAGQYNTSHATSLIHGAAMMVPTRIIRQAGLMPELYFLYYEELDWCEMIKRMGYHSYYEAGATVYHKESASVGQGSAMRTYYLNRNRLLFIRRNSRGWHFWSGFLFFLFVAVPKNSVAYAVRNQWAHLRALWRGLGWHLRGHNIHQNHFLPH